MMHIKLPLFILFVVSNAHCATLIIIDSEDGSHFRTETVNGDDLLNFNKHVLGIGSMEEKGNYYPLKDGERPRALVVFSIEGIELLNSYQGDEYLFKPSSNSRKTRRLIKEFGESMNYAIVDSKGINGSNIANVAGMMKERVESFMTNDTIIQNEIINLSKLGAAIQNVHINDNEGVDYYRIHFTLPMEATQNSLALFDIHASIKQFMGDVKKAYSNKAMFQVFSYVRTINSRRFENMRREFHVTRPVSPDYPAMVTICGFVALVFLFSAVSFVWFMFQSMDSDKAPIYRYSNLKSKKSL